MSSSQITVDSKNSSQITRLILEGTVAQVVERGPPFYVSLSKMLNLKRLQMSMPACVCATMSLKNYIYIIQICSALYVLKVIAAWITFSGSIFPVVDVLLHRGSRPESRLYRLRFSEIALWLRLGGKSWFQLNVDKVNFLGLLITAFNI